MKSSDPFHDTEFQEISMWQRHIEVGLWGATSIFLTANSIMLSVVSRIEVFTYEAFISVTFIILDIILFIVGLKLILISQNLRERQDKIAELKHESGDHSWHDFLICFHSRIFGDKGLKFIAGYKINALIKVEACLVKLRDKCLPEGIKAASKTVWGKLLFLQTSLFVLIWIGILFC